MPNGMHCKQTNELYELAIEAPSTHTGGSCSHYENSLLVLGIL